MKKLFFLSILCVYSCFSHAQLNPDFSPEHNIRSFINEINRKNLNFSRDIQGQLYLYKNWGNGKIYSSRFLSLPKETKYNFFTFTEEIHVINKNKDTLVVQANSLIDSIIFNQKKFITCNYENNDKIKLGYFQQLNNGNVKLLKKYKCIFIKGNYKNASGYEKIKPDRYEIRYNYYFLDENKIAHQVSKKKKNLLPIFPKHKEKIKEYIKKNKTKKEEHLIKLFEYYNSL